jgi:hypothetical protein
VDKDVREAAVMAASELAENSVKYGEPIQSEDCAYISYSVRPTAIVIRTMNGVTTPKRVEQVASCIDAINASDDPGALYAQRLTEMLASPSDDSRLGLLRIAYEGSFRLAYSYEPPVLTVTATRVLK